MPATLERASQNAALAEVGAAVGASFGDPKAPLLVSVRSGARASMPGMMDTILNLGLNDATVEGLAAKSGNARFAYDSYRRFIQMYANVVLDVDHGVFEDILDNHKNLNGYAIGHRPWRGRLARRDRRLQGAVEKETGKPFPQSTDDQLWGAIGAVFEFLAQCPRQNLSAPTWHSRQLGYRRQCASHGVRQPGRHICHRRRLHAQSIHRCPRTLRRISAQRPGRGCGRRHPHTPAAERGRAARGG